MLTLIENQMPPMTEYEINRVADLESYARSMPQVAVPTEQILHAGLYMRTIFMPAGTILTGALIKIATALIISGHARVYMGNEIRDIVGYHVMRAASNRKQAFYALGDTHLTMAFASAARTTEDAELEFTDESDKLLTRLGEQSNGITITEG